jgi:uncharacterized protein YkwD
MSKVCHSSQSKRAFIMLCMVFSIIAAPPVSPSPAHDSICPNNQEQELIDLINQERQKAGLSSLKTDVRLMKAARQHSAQMAVKNFFGHSGYDASSLREKFAKAGYPMTIAAENIAAVHATPDSVLRAWMKSPGHRANILNKSVREIGIGYYYLRHSPYVHYWTADFGCSTDRCELTSPKCGGRQILR